MVEVMVVRHCWMLMLDGGPHQLELDVCVCIRRCNARFGDVSGFWYDWSII